MVTDKVLPSHVQIIEKEGKPEWVVIPYEMYNRILAELKLQRIPDSYADTGYDETQDSVIALLQGPEDLSECHEDILRDEGQPYSGWTQKEALP